MKVIQSCCLFLITITSSFAQVGIGTIAPQTDAVLELKSSTNALLVSRVANTSAIANPFNGMIIYDLSTNCFKSYENDNWSMCWSAIAATISTIDCVGVVNTGTLTHGVVASGVSSVFSYTDGNEGIITGQTISSTGVKGLTATLGAGNLAIGSGTVSYAITGTPDSIGTASFVISLAKHNCTLSLTVN